MKKAEIRQIFAVFNQLGNVKCNARFAYALGKNKAKMKEEIAAIVEMEKCLIDYEKKRIVLCREHCDKDEKGRPIMVENRFQGLESNGSFSVAMEDLRKEYQPKLDEVNNVLEDELEKPIEFHKIRIDDFPNEITPFQMEILMPLILDDGDRENAEHKDDKPKLSLRR